MKRYCVHTRTTPPKEMLSMYFVCVLLNTLVIRRCALYIAFLWENFGWMRLKLNIFYQCMERANIRLSFVKVGIFFSKFCRFNLFVNKREAQFLCKIWYMYTKNIKMINKKRKAKNESSINKIYFWIKAFYWREIDDKKNGSLAHEWITKRFLNCLQTRFFFYFINKLL